MTRKMWVQVMLILALGFLIGVLVAGESFWRAASIWGAVALAATLSVYSWEH